MNKVDLLEDRSVLQRLRLKYPRTVSISALKHEGFETLFDEMMKEISSLRKIVRLRIPQSHYELVSEVMKEGRVIFTEYEENDVILKAEIPQQLEHKVREFIVD